jgi:hypothetical protein
MSNLTINNLGDVKPVVVAGGKTGNFVPNLNSSFHSDEFFFNLNRKDKVVTSESVVTENGKTKLTTGDDIDIFHIDEKGRLKWDIEFTEKPKSNKITWELKYSKGIEFYRQNALSEEEKKYGLERSDDIVGSYAVYCNNKHNNYKTGKLCHIYKPFCIDATGKEVYAELFIDNKNLTITIPQDYLDTAVYPVILDPTFGYTSVGASGLHADGYAFGCKFTGAAGTATSLSAYVTSATSKNWKYALFSNNSNTLTLVSGTTEGSGIASGWSELALSSSSVISASSYALVLQGVDTTVYFYYDSGGDSGQQGYRDRTYSSAWATPETWAFPNSNRLSVYCTYSTGETGNNYYYQQQQM